MTTPTARSTACPNCGAPIGFRWAQAVQTTCAYCKAVLVRTDLDLQQVGKQADFPHTGSPIQLGTEGTWGSRAFVVVGRIAYAWARGRWNEWHCRLSDGSSAWLSDAQLEYAMTRELAIERPLPALTGVQVGESFTWDGIQYEVAGITRASYAGTEGELPFTSFGREECVFVDLQNGAGGLATIDGSETPSVLYVGEYLTFDELAFRQLRAFEGW